MFKRNKHNAINIFSVLLLVCTVLLLIAITATATVTTTGGVGRNVEDEVPPTSLEEVVESAVSSVIMEQPVEVVSQNSVTSSDIESTYNEEGNTVEEVPLTIGGEESAEQKANSYQLHRRHFRTPSVASSSDNQADTGDGNHNNNPALGIDHPDSSSEKELYRRRSASLDAAVNGGGGPSSSSDTVVEESPIDLPCHLINEEQVRREQHTYPIVLNYTDALANIVNLLQALREQYTAEHHYVCPADKMSELRKLLNVLGELQYFHTRRDKLRLLGGKSFGTLGPQCASHIIIASDVFRTWAVAVETVYNGISASEGHCTTGWANFLAFLSNAPGLQEPQLRTPECMKRPSYARCFLNN